MAVKGLIFNELLKNGYSKEKGKRMWNVANPKLWYLTSEGVEGYMKMKKYEPYINNIDKPEIVLLKREIPKLIKRNNYKSFNLIDIGCGDGVKAEHLIKSTPKEVKIRYCPIDISPVLIDMTVNRIKGLNLSRVSKVKEFVSDFEEMRDIIPILRSGEYPRNLCFMLGSTISYFDINDFLYNISNLMFSGDCLLIGNGIRKGKRFVSLYKYRNEIINQWFVHVMLELGFDKKEIEWDARFENGRVEGIYRINSDKIIEHEGKKINFKKGDGVLVGYQYKYYTRELKKFCGMYFRQVELTEDPTGEFALVTCIK